MSPAATATSGGVKKRRRDLRDTVRTEVRGMQNQGSAKVTISERRSDQGGPLLRVRTPLTLDPAVQDDLRRRAEAVRMGVTFELFS